MQRPSDDLSCYRQIHVVLKNSNRILCIAFLTEGLFVVKKKLFIAVSRCHGIYKSAKLC